MAFYSLTPTRVEKILAHLQIGAEFAVDLLDDLRLSSGEFQRKYKRSLSGRGPRPFKADWAQWYRQRRIYATTLSRMKTQGLIKRSAKDDGGKWKITEKGSKRLERIHIQRRNPYSVATAHFTPSSKQEVVIIAFDIPEREKIKRRWLREALKSLSFKLLQKSVWIGTNGLPEEFMKALQERRLLSHVHIVGVGKTGTLGHITEPRGQK